LQEAHPFAERVGVSQLCARHGIPTSLPEVLKMPRREYEKLRIVLSRLEAERSATPTV